MIQYALLALCGFGFVFLKAFQQRSVAADNYVAIVPTSVAMAAMELFTVANIAKLGWHFGVVLAVGLASGTGAMAAMWTHGRLFRKT